MKKMLRTIAAVLSIMLCLSLPAYAAEGFDASVFANREEVVFTWDEITGDSSAYIEPTVDAESEDGWVVMLTPVVTSKDTLDLYTLGFGYVGKSWPYFDKIYIKIGDVSYIFPVWIDQKETIPDGLVMETTIIPIAQSSAVFMQDLIAHQSEENVIKIRLSGQNQTIDFDLSQQTKDSIIHMYNLFSAAGGTRSSNLRLIDSALDDSEKMTTKNITPIG